MRHPPLNVVTGSAIIFFEKPTFSIISATSSLVEPQAWMRLRVARVEMRSTLHDDGVGSSTTLNDAIDAPRASKTDAGDATGR